jgi:hypothetical protein
MYDAIHGWMTGRMDGWMESFMTSFTICNFEVFNCLKSCLGLHLFFSRPQMCFRKKIPSNICKTMNMREKKIEKKE